MSSPPALATGVEEFTRFGTFANSAIESSFRSNLAEADRRTTRACVLVALLGSLVFINSDFLLFGDSTQFYVLLAARAGVILLSLLFWQQLRRDLSATDFDYLTFCWVLLVVTQILFVTSTRPPSYSGHTIVNLSAVLLLYTIIPLPLKCQAALAGILSVGCTLLAIGNSLWVFAVSWSLLGANVLGVFVSHRLHCWGREMFATRLRLEKSLAEVRTLRGLIRVCAWCKKVAVEEEWEELESYVRDNTHAEFTHGMCPDCYSTQVERMRGQALIGEVISLRAQRPGTRGEPEEV